MFNRVFGRVVVTTFFAVGLLMATAVPASASATGFVIEGSSTVSIAPGWVDLSQHFESHPTSNVCAPNSTNPTVFPVAFDSSGGGSITSTTTGWTDFSAGTNAFKRRLTIVSGDFSMSATGTSLTLVFRYEYRTCNSLTSLCTTHNVSITLTGPPVGHHPTASVQVTLTGTTANHITVAIGCNTILRDVLVSETATASLNLHFT
ncbi:MAG TPA: hypothetical protein VFU19_02385 [Iamia sp.]|nr:hypothetical protein [Iamia sp.]